MAQAFLLELTEALQRQTQTWQQLNGPGKLFEDEGNLQHGCMIPAGPGYGLFCENGNVAVCDSGAEIQPGGAVD
eukprot:1356363-Prorocentrum_lima.AAC.1